MQNAQDLHPFPLKAFPPSSKGSQAQVLQVTNLPSSASLVPVVWNLTHAGPKKNGSAFTLIEAALAIALGAALVIVALGILASLTQTHPDAKPDAAPSADISSLVQIIRKDLLHARQYRVEENEVVLFGYGSLDEKTFEYTHQPCEVRYAVRSDGSRSWLIRQQMPAASAGPPKPWAELIYAGIERIQMASAKAAGGGVEAAIERLTTPGKRLPSRVRITLTSDSSAQPVVDEEIILYK